MPRAGPSGVRRAHPPPLTDASFPSRSSPPASSCWEAPAALRAQEPRRLRPVDSIAVEGNSRLTASQIIGTSGIIVRQPINYRDIQRAITSLFRTGQFDDVVVEQRNVGGRLILVIKVKERPVLEKWAVRGVSRVSEGDVKGRVKLIGGPAARPERRRAGPRRHRLALQGQGLLRVAGEGAPAAPGVAGRSGWSST